MLELNHTNKNSTPAGSVVPLAMFLTGKTDQILALSLQSRNEVCHWLSVFTVFWFEPSVDFFPMFLRIFSNVSKDLCSNVSKDLFSNVSEDLFSNVSEDLFSKGNVFLLQLQPAMHLPRSVGRRRRVQTSCFTTKIIDQLPSRPLGGLTGSPPHFQEQLPSLRPPEQS